MPSAAEIYQVRLAERRGTAAGLAVRARRLSHLRLVAFGLIGLTGWLALGRHLLSPGWMAAPGFLFGVLVAWHHRVIEARLRAERAAAFYERGLARLRGDWAQASRAGERFFEADHPYDRDLDIFGEGSLFQLLNTARTRSGERTLANWLRTHAEIGEVRARQAAVQELRPRIDRREQLAVLGETLEAGMNPDALRDWGNRPLLVASRAVRLTALFFAVASTLGLVGLFVVPTVALFVAPVVFAVQGAFAWRWKGAVTESFKAAQRACADLDLFAGVIAHLEAGSFESYKLTALQAELQTDGVPPSRQLRALQLRVELLDARMNQLFAPLAVLWLWTTQVTFAIEAWRARCGPRLGRWIDVIGEFEALSSLGSHAFENPDDPYPELNDDGAQFEANALGHPLLPRDRCVRNHVRLDAGTPLLMVSGSNMSGKSTLLRAVGTNAVLALAGAPVRAKTLSLSPLRVGASIQTLDSLQEGKSRFYAEITRIGQVVALARGERPALFLLDEMLQGTNSHDRRMGSEAVLRALVEAGAIGLATTHDLALTEIAEQLPGATNIHFQDELVDGRMAFDYMIRKGVVAKSNALALMRAVGLLGDDTGGNAFVSP